MASVIFEIQDEVNVHIKNLDTATRRKLVKEVSYFLPKARYSANYATGRWDGRISFCTQGGRTYINVLDRLIPIIEASGYEVDPSTSVVFKNPRRKSPTFASISADIFANYVWPVHHRLAGQPITLEEHQVNAANNFLANPQAIQEISTGAGKTLLIAALADRVGSYGRSIIIVPNKDLVRQTQEEMELVGLDVGVYYGDKKMLGHRHTIYTWQTLNSLYKQFQDGDIDLREHLDDVGTVIVDETHIARSDVVRKLLCGPLSSVPIRWGLTGTVPPDEWEYMSLLCAIGPVVGSVSARELQDNGFLADSSINVIRITETAGFDSFPSELSYLLNDTERLDFLTELIREITKSGNTLVLVERINAGKALSERLGNGTEFIHGTVHSDQRKQHYAFVNDNDNIPIIATYGVASVGINLPRIYNLVLIEPGKSFIRTVQSIGRSLRRARDKDSATIWDVSSTTKYSTRHLTQRKKFYKEQQHPFFVHKISYFGNYRDELNRLFDKLRGER